MRDQSTKLRPKANPAHARARTLRKKVSDHKRSSNTPVAPYQLVELQDGDAVSWQESPKARLEAPLVAELWQRLCEWLEKSLPPAELKKLDYSGRDQGPSQRTLEGLCQVVHANHRQFFRDVPPPVKDALLYFTTADKLIRDRQSFPCRNQFATWSIR